MIEQDLSGRILPFDSAAAQAYAEIAAQPRAAYSGVIRPVIPKVSGHPFRFYPATDSGASGHPVM